MNNIRKLSKSKLLDIIQEELENFLSEEDESEIEELALRLMKNDPSLSKEEAISIARSAAFRKQQQGTIDYSSKTGSHEDDDAATLNLIRPRLEAADPQAETEKVPALQRPKLSATTKEPALKRDVWTREQKDTLLKLSANITQRFESVEALVDEIYSKLVR